MSPLRRHSRLALLGVAASAVAVSGCGGGEKPPAATTLVTRAAAATGAQKRFHFTYDEQNGPKSTKGVHLTFADGDVVVPDRVQADVSGTFIGLPVRTKLVVIGERTWLKNPLTGRWEQVNVGTKAGSFFDPGRGVLAVIRGARDLTVAGSETIGDVKTWHLSGKTTVGSISPLLGNPGGPRLVAVDLWVDKDTGRLVRLRLSGEVERGDSAGTVRTIDLSRYGAPVSIVPPAGG